VKEIPQEKVQNQLTR